MERPAEYEHAQRHIHALYDISKQLIGFVSPDATLPRILEIVAQALVLRTAVLLLDSEEGETERLAWHAPGVREDELESAILRVEQTYNLLTRRARATGAEPARPRPGAITLPRVPHDGDERLLALPLVIGQHPVFGMLQLGVLELEARTPLDELDLAFVNAVANQLAIAIARHRAELGRLKDERSRRSSAERGRAFEEQRASAEEEKRIVAEGVSERQSFLSLASALLSASLESPDLLQSLARLCAERIANVCLVLLSEYARPGAATVVALASADPETARRARSAVEQWPPEMDVERGPGRALKTGEAEIFPNAAPPPPLPALGREHPAFLRALDTGSYLCMPLTAGDRVLGVLTMVRSTVREAFGQADLYLAREIARRASLAVENARLYRERQREVAVRDSILAVVSHDLRNPLAAIRGATHMLEATQVTEEGRRRHAAAIGRSVDRMNRLIADLLDFSSIEAGRLSIEMRPQNLQILVLEGREMLEALAVKKSLRFSIEVREGTPPILCDRERILQVLSNLVGNAVKFTNEGGAINVRVGPHEGGVLFEVQDSGSGIAEGELPHVFERYWKSPGTAPQGTGLGLAIAKGIIEAHGGRIWVRSAAGAGSTFFFTVRAAAPDLTASPTPPPAPLA